MIYVLAIGIISELVPEALYFTGIVLRKADLARINAPVPSLASEFLINERVKRVAITVLESYS